MKDTHTIQTGIAIVTFAILTIIFVTLYIPYVALRFVMVKLATFLLWFGEELFESEKEIEPD